MSQDGRAALRWGGLLALALGLLSCRSPGDAAAQGGGQVTPSEGVRAAPPADSPGALRPLVAREVLLIGDSYLEVPDRELNAELSRLARAAGLIGPSEQFRDAAIGGTKLVGGTRPIPSQYTNAQGQSPARLLIMDGGGNDINDADCADCAPLSKAVVAAKDLFERLASDRSVEAIVYFFYPDLPDFPDYRADAADFLRPQLEALCAASTVPCTFLDLRPLFRGHPEFIGADHLHPSVEGAHAMARAIFELIRSHRAWRSRTPASG